MWRRIALAALVWMASLCQAGVSVSSPLATLATDWQQALASGQTAAVLSRFPYSRCFREAARRHRVDQGLLVAVARGESDFQPTAISKANAIGVMQIQWPQTARHLGIYRRALLYRPCDNIDAGARYLKELLVRYRGQTHLALAAYNYGPGRIDVDATAIPDGALWYSRYILSHHEYVVGSTVAGGSAGNAIESMDYREEGQLVLIHFRRPYRADAYVALLRQQLPGVQFSWFRLPDFSYKVVAGYQGAEGRRLLVSRLRQAGFAL